jgi:mono/diheme cytochrome c family protein
MHMFGKSCWTLVVAAGLVACGGEKKPEASTPAPDTATPVAAATNLGEEKYTAVCSACHQPTGLGVEGNFPPLAGSDWLTGKPEVPIAIVLHGLQGEIEVAGKKYNGAMAPWGETLNDAEIAAVLTHERSSWGNTAPAVTAEEVKTVRAKYATRTTPWTVAELTPLR